MKAATYHKYGGPDVVSITNVPRPEIKDDEILIRVHASTVSSGDWRLRSQTAPRGMGLAIRLFTGLFGPRQPILGADAAGVVVEKGSQVAGWEIGDAVIAYPSASMGCHAQYLAMPSDGIIALKPTAISFVEAAAIPFGGLTALEFLRDKGKLRAGERVLIVGASGATGSAAVQLARHFGAHVTGVCSAENGELVASLGAEKVIDYRREDFTRTQERYDMILDTTGTAPWKRIKHMLSARGRLVIISGGLGDMVRGSRNPQIIGGVSNGSTKGLQELLQIVQKGGFFPLIDRVYPFEHVLKAHAHVDTGRKKGAVVLSILPETGEQSPIFSTQKELVK